ncbi:NYN domain-containing protein [Pseudorhizobium pelagicum]|mgnify:FL=1|uniref:NYN domain-containing protein n=1 Tax=Pseudorhizobium pelagicum TaxID=1509405 RepID=UPI000565D413|nr:NYN domain-containing protein [Pseudorhizobium pelagicum]
MATDTLALLIDGDNASPKVISGLLAEIANYGTASVKRIYGDWTKPNLNGWKECLLEHSIQPVQQFAYTTGKNATDGAMIIDAMDLLYTGRFSGFCIVSSDSDFARLASRIREQGITVYGFGERKTPRPFITACDKFIYVDVLSSLAEGTEVQAAAPAKAVDAPKAAPKPAKAPAEKARPPQGAAASGKLDKAALEMLRKAVEATAEEDGRANLGRVGTHLAKQSPDFEARNYGYARLSDLAEASGILVVERTGEQNKVVTVRLKKKAQKPEAQALSPVAT